jgi:hypothetical protein
MAVLLSACKFQRLPHQNLADSRSSHHFRAGNLPLSTDTTLFRQLSVEMFSFLL